MRKKPAPVVVPDLVIVGTNVGKVAAPAPPEPKPVAPQPAPIDSPKNVVPAGPAIAKTEVPAHPNQVTPVAPPVEYHPAPATTKIELAAAVSTNRTIGSASTEPAGKPSPTWVWIAGGLSVLAAGLALVWFFRPGRRVQSSLITSSMQDESHRK